MNFCCKCCSAVPSHNSLPRSKAIYARNRRFNFCMCVCWFIFSSYVSYLIFQGYAQSFIFVAAILSDVAWWWVRTLNLPSRCLKFHSRPFNFHVTILGKLFTHVCLCHQAALIGIGQRVVIRDESTLGIPMDPRVSWESHVNGNR